MTLANGVMTKMVRNHLLLLDQDDNLLMCEEVINAEEEVKSFQRIVTSFELDVDQIN